VFRLKDPQQSERERKRRLDRRRPGGAARGYDNAWSKVRKVKLLQDPVCAFCNGRLATEVDHIRSIKERPDLRLEMTNLRSACRPCHSRRTAKEQGFARPRREVP
jgi:5-methylcytosine-specific restriction endonuclease McrA